MRIGGIAEINTMVIASATVFRPAMMMTAIIAAGVTDDMPMRIIAAKIETPIMNSSPRDDTVMNRDAIQIRIMKTAAVTVSIHPTRTTGKNAGQ